MTSSPSPICLVNGASSANGTNTTAGAAVSVQLADLTGVNAWELTCLYTDEANTAAAVNATVVITSAITKTATFTMPSTATGSAVILQSRVNGGVDVNGKTQASYSTNFEVHVLAAGLRLAALNETTESGVYGWLAKVNAAIRAAGVVGGGGSAGGSNTQVQYNSTGTFGGSSTFTFDSGTGTVSATGLNATNVTLAATGILTVGALASTTGTIRLPAINSIKLRNAANSADINLIGSASDIITIGNQTSISAVEMYANTTRLWGTSAVDIYNTSGSGFALHVTSSTFETGLPIIGGNGTQYGVHGVGVQAMGDASQTPTSSIYKYNTIKTTGALTTNRNLTLPSATDAAAYTKIINNICTGAFAVVVTTGTGTTVTVTNLTTVTVLVDSRGVTQVGVATSGAGSFTAAGDLTGTSSSQTVAKVNGATVPAAGALTTGNSAYVSGVSALTYSALNLAGGSGWITGTLPVANGGTGITSLGSGVATFWGAPSSVNLAAAVTDETGTGALVFGTSPTFTTNILINNPANTFAYTLTPSAIVANRAITIPLLAGDDTLVTAAFTQTLTNKTLTAPVISSITNSGVLTLPASTDTLVGRATTDTLTNKTLTSPVLGGTPSISAATTITSGNAKGVNTDRQPVNVQTTDATVTTLDSFTLGSNTNVVCSWLVTCVQSTSATAGAFSVSAVFRNNAGTVTQVGTSTTTVLGTDDAAYTCTIDNSTTTIRLRVTGKASTTLQWTGIATTLTVIP